MSPAGACYAAQRSEKLERPKTVMKRPKLYLAERIETMWNQPEPMELRGECDRCHQIADLWQIDDDPGAWLYCLACANTLCPA